MPFLPQAFVLGSSMPFLPQAFMLGSFYAFFATGFCVRFFYVFFCRMQGLHRVEEGGVGREDVTRPLPLRKFAACDIITLEGTA